MLTIALYQDDQHREEVISLWTRVFGARGGHREAGVSIDLKVAKADGLFFVALRGSQVLGTLMAGWDGHRGWLYSVCSDPAYRRQGIGQALVRHSEQALAALGCLKVNLQVDGANTSVVPFYQALGYEIEPHVSLGKRLY
jgi:ribosomal protein S18 acetylase RimI-like enzyme